jgi:hypothetical protein
VTWADSGGASWDTADSMDTDTDMSMDSDSGVVSWPDTATLGDSGIGMGSDSSFSWLDSAMYFDTGDTWNH